MQLSSIDVLNARGTKLTLPLDDNPVGFSIKNIDGLDPVVATISSGSFANLDGEQFHSARRQKRNIKITLGLNPDYAVSDVKALRDQLYAYFAPKATVSLKFNHYNRFAQTIADETFTLAIEGRVESFTSALFTQTPQVDISILCFNPDFYDPKVITVSGDFNTPLDINYEGTEPTGIQLYIVSLGETHTYDLTQQTPDGNYHNMSLAWPMFRENTSSIVIDTIPGEKSVMFSIYGGGYTQSILYGLSTTSEWIQLQPGLNRFAFSYSGPDNATFDLKYTNKYGGL